MSEQTNRTAARIAIFIAIIAVIVAVLCNVQPAKDTPPQPGVAAGGQLQPADKPPATAPNPRLIVRSTPSGASLLINGKLMGATPVTVDSLSAGSYGLRLEKEGCRPSLLNVSVSSGDAIVEQKLEPAATGSLVVEVTPDGAEVLLDGEIAGNTPLRLNSVPAGSYELLVRKTNCESYSKIINVEAGETLTFAGFDLKDKVLAMMEGMVRAEPQRLAHYIDLGHYLFIENKMDEAVDVFTQGLELMKAPLDFDGPGYPGKANLSLAEMQLDQRLRKEDEARFLKELDKHRNWPRIDTKTFRKKMDEAQEMVSRKNIALWTWAERAARIHIQNKNYERAAKIYEEHIAAAPKDSPDLPRAYTALAEVYLTQNDIPKAKGLYTKLNEQFSKDANALFAFGKMAASYHDRVVGKDKRAEVLSLAESALRQSTELPDNGSKLVAMLELGNVLVLEEHPDQAIPLFQTAVDGTQDIVTREDRELRLGDALRRANRFDDATQLFKRLALSDRASVRGAANVGLEYIATQERTRKKQEKKE